MNHVQPIGAVANGVQINVITVGTARKAYLIIKTLVERVSWANNQSMHCVQNGWVQVHIAQLNPDQCCESACDR